jgi:CRP-like cAMP-binding protein
MEPLPAAELADRIRRIPLFSFASVNELFRIAGLGRQVRYEGGRILCEQGRPPESLLFLLDGKVTVDAARHRVIEAPAVIGLENVMEGSPVAATVRASEPCICLSLTSEEFLSLLSENVEITQGIFRLLIESGGGALRTLASTPGERVEWPTVLHGQISPDLERRIDRGMQPVELGMLLQTSAILSRATTSQLVALAGIARPTPLKTGADPLEGFEQSVLVVLSGAVRVEREGHEAELAEPGDLIGLAETLGGLPVTLRGEVVREGEGLRFSRTELFDVLAENIDLVQGIFSGLLRARAPGVPA